MADRFGQQLGSYRLIRLLGYGGAAEVYLGEHVYLKTLVAIKVSQVSLESGSQESFLNEARLLARLDHSNIERVLEVGIENATPFLVKEYAPNGTLRERHPRGAPLTLAQTVSYVEQIASALQYVHDRGLVHRDIKPENMLLGRNKEVLLSDFGIATLSHTSTSFSSQNLAGAVAYMAPEQLQGKARRASDQYSLAIVVYEWLTGRLPFQGSFDEIASQHLYTPPPLLRTINPSIPPEVEQVVMKALAKDPQQRFASVQEFATAFGQASNLGQQAFFSRPLLESIDSPTIAASGRPSLTLPDASSPEGNLPASSALPPPTEEYRRAVKDAWASKTLTAAKVNKLKAEINRLHLSNDQVAAIEREIMGGDKESILAAKLHEDTKADTGAFQSPPPSIRDSRNTPVTSQRSSITKGLGNALKKIASGKKDNKQQAKELSLFAIARTTVDNNNQAIVGNTYNIEAGISQNSPESFRGEPIRVRAQNAVDPLMFDILIHPGDNVELLGTWYQRLRYNPGSAEPQFIACSFRLKAPERGHLIIHFYRERQWLKAIRFEFEGILQSQSFATTSGR